MGTAKHTDGVSERIQRQLASHTPVSPGRAAAALRTRIFAARTLEHNVGPTRRRTDARQDRVSRRLKNENVMEVHG